MRRAKLFFFLLSWILGVPAALGQTLVRPLTDSDQVPIDLMLRVTDDPDYLTARQASLRNKLLTFGVDPLQPERVSLNTLFRQRMGEAGSVSWFEPARTVEVHELDWSSRQVRVFRYPRYFAFESQVDTNRVGIAFKAPRAVADSVVTVDLVDLSSWHRTWVSIGVQDQWEKDIRNRQFATGTDDGLLNFRLPVKIPRSLERIIGKGEATSIRITGQESISIAGESRRQSNFRGNEIQQSQSLFPALEMKQELRVNLDGTVGEKIKVRVTHDSQRFGDQATEVKLAFEGDEDDIIRTIRAGDIDVTLPGSRLLGVGAKRGGLFGIKVEGALGGLQFTLVTSKEEDREGKAKFNQSGGSEQEFRVRNVDFISERFFRLTAPVPFFYDGILTPDQILADESGIRWQPGWRIDVNSLEIYQSFKGQSDDGTSDQAMAIVDQTGIGWEGTDGIIDDLSGVSYATDSFRRLLPGTDWQSLTAQEQLIGIALTSPVPKDTAILAVTYDIVDADGNLVRRVGRSIDHPDPLVPDPLTGELQNIFKMIKPKERSTPFGDVDNPTTPGPFDLTWEYMYRNFYDLKGSEIDPTSFQMQIHVASNNGESPDLDSISPEPVPWIKVFGLDRLDASGNPGTGGDLVVDVTDPLLFNFQLGYIQFPTFRPFSSLPDPGLPAESQRFDEFSGVANYLDEPADDESHLLKNNFSDALYTQHLSSPQDFQDNTKFNLVFSHASTSSRFRLNSFSIKEGSEEVFLDGQLLVRGTHYDIDYFTGEINLTGAAHRITPNSNITVEYDEGSLFGAGRTSLHGIYLGYEFGNNRTLNTTWLLQTQPNRAQKPKLGEEPSRNWVGNIQGRAQFSPQWLREFINLLPTVRSDREVNFTTDGELALSIPNPNTNGKAYLEDFENVDDSDVIPLGRDGWFWPSLPAVPDIDGRRRFDPEDRVYSRWHRQNPGVNRGALNPELSTEEQRDVVPTLVLHMESQEDSWQEEEFGGIMRGFPGSMDLTQTQFLEFWVNDFTPAAAQREGILHFDFGTINEDFFWTSSENDSLITGEFDQEDQDNDGRLGIVNGATEDTGLDGVPDGAEAASLYPQRLPTGNDQAGDNFRPQAINQNARFKEFLYINGTEDNQRLDSEDLNRDNSFGFQDGYYTLSLDLSSPDAIVDVLRDYPDAPLDVIDPDNLRYAWRKYRLDFRDLQIRTANDVIVDDPRYFAAQPDLSRIKHMRIWYENPDGTARTPEVTLVFTDVRFLGNRWLADGIRDLEHDRILETGLEGFRVGVVNNKENPDYVPPVFPDTRNNVAEKEQSLQFIYSDLESGHLFRARNQIPGFDGQDFSVYRELNFFWRAPFTDGIRNEAQDHLEPYYWVGSDSTNYYEISFAFDEVELDQDWQECSVDLAALTNVKNQPLEPLVPGSSVEVRRGVVEDRLTGEQYRVVVRGRPDLRRIRTHYAGVRYPLEVDLTGQTTGPPLTGEVLFNEIRLQEVNRDVGLAKSVSAQLEMPGFGNLGFEWSETDAEFRGLNQRVGGGILQRSWNARANSNLKNLLPTFGFDVPFNISTRRRLDLPKFFPASDIELLDRADREAERTETRNANFSFQVRRSDQSDNPWMQYTLDALNYSLSGSRQKRFAPSQESGTKTASSKLDYDVRLPPQGFQVPIPFTKSRFRYLPTQITMGASMDYQFSERTDKFRDRDPALVRRPDNASKGMNLRATVVMAPMQGLNGRWSVTSNRNLVLSAEENIIVKTVYDAEDSTKIDHHVFERPDTKFLGLIDIGREDSHQESFSLNLTPNVPIIKWFDPDIQYTASYGESRAPTIRQRGVNSVFIGEPRQVRNFSNRSDTTVRGKVDAFGWIKRRLARRGPARQDPRRNPEEDRPRTPQPPPRGDIVDERAVEEEDVDEGEEDAGEPDEPEAEEAAPDQPEGPGTPPATTLQDLMSDVDQQRQEEQERAEQEETEPEAPAEDESPPIDPRQALLNLVRPFGRVFGNMQPLTSSYTFKRDSNYSHVNERARLWYRLGFTTDIGDVAPVDPTVSTQQFSGNQFNTQHRVSFNTQTQLAETIRMDMTYTGDFRIRDGSNTAEVRNRSVEFPSTTVRIQRVHEWPMFGDLFSNSSIDVSVRRSSRLSGSSQVTEPQIDWTIGPRWSVSFPNGTDANIHGRYQTSSQPAPQHENRSQGINVTASVSKKFDADGRLAFLRFGRSGTGTTIDMDLQMSYDRNKRFRIKDGIEDQSTGSQTIEVSPNFSYQFSRNLRAGLRLRYSQTTNLALENAVTRAVSVGLNATLTF